MTRRILVRYTQGAWHVFPWWDMMSTRWFDTWQEAMDHANYLVKVHSS